MNRCKAILSIFSDTYHKNELDDVEKTYLHRFFLTFLKKEMQNAFSEYRRSNLFYWILFISYWGAVHNIYQAYFEFSGVHRAENYTHWDFYIHMICDIFMLTYSLVAYVYPQMFDFVGMWWWLMYCIYHYFTARLEHYTPNEVRLLMGDLTCYYVMLAVCLNSKHWVLESFFMLTTFLGVCYLMSLNAVTSAGFICINEFQLKEGDTSYENCRSWFLS